MWGSFSGVATLLLSAAARVQENVTLKGAVANWTKTICCACHLLDYRRQNAMFLNRQA
jgi:hypothetical protein